MLKTRKYDRMTEIYKLVEYGGVKMDKRKGFLVSYLIIPVCFLVAVIAVGLIRKHSLIEIYNDGLGITALYYLFVSLFIYIRWEHFSNKK